MGVLVMVTELSVHRIEKVACGVVCGVQKPLSDLACDMWL
jgi:hypothetical protein